MVMNIPPSKKPQKEIILLVLHVKNYLVATYF